MSNTKDKLARIIISVLVALFCLILFWGITKLITSIPSWALGYFAIYQAGYIAGSIANILKP